jgi:hypothetical protein
VSILDPIDDLTWTHEAHFAKDERGLMRKAWAFRWLQSAKLFCPHTFSQLV